MRGQAMNAEQRAAVQRLLAKGWRAASMFALSVPLCRDREFRFGRWLQSPDPCVIHVRRDGSIHRGYPRSRRESQEVNHASRL
jgi:hypothetical protein